jgi:hypothetical protein
MRPWIIIIHFQQCPRVSEHYTTLEIRAPDIGDGSEQLVVSRTFHVRWSAPSKHADRIPPRVRPYFYCGTLWSGYAAHSVP